MRTMTQKILRAGAALALGAAAFGLSTTDADAKPRHRHKHRHDGCHGHAVVVARPVVYRAPVYAYRPVPVVYPAPVYAYRPVPVVPAPYPYPYAHGPVVYDRHHDGVDGFIGISGPHVSIGIGF